MARAHLTSMAASAAYQELQAAYGILYCDISDDESSEKKAVNLIEAEKHLKTVNDWLQALKNE